MRVLFDHCQYGGERKKTTRLVHSIPEFQHLESFCDGSHEHQAWGLQHGVWTTSLETAYPLELCKTMADYFKRQLLFLGVANVPSSLGDSNAGSSIHLAQASIGKQPRGKKLPPLVSEFRQVIELVTPLAVNLYQPRFRLNGLFPQIAEQLRAWFPCRLELGYCAGSGMGVLEPAMKVFKPAKTGLLFMGAKILFLHRLIRSCRRCFALLGSLGRLRSSSPRPHQLNTRKIL